MKSHLVTLIGLLAVSLMICPLLVWAEEQAEVEVEVFVSATKTEQSPNELSSTTSVITSEEIEESQATSLSELLAGENGLDVVFLGSPGKVTSVFMRGGNSNHVLLLVDGVKINNPAAGGAVLEHLSLDQVGRVEIVRGAMGTLYGSDAVTGLMQVFTKPGSVTPTTVSLGSGSADALRGSFSYGTGAGDTGFALSGSSYEHDGFVSDNDDYARKTLAGRWDNEFSGGLLTLTGRYYDAETGNAGSLFLPDINARQSNKGIIAGATWRRETVDNCDTLRTGWFAPKLNIYNPEDPPGTGLSTTDIDSSALQLGYQHDWIGDEKRVSVGIEYQDQDAKYNDVSPWGSTTYDKGYDTKAAFAQMQGSRGDYRYVAGARYEDNETFGSQTTYRLNIAKLTDGGDTRWWAAYGTSFRAPSLNDLYFPGYGDPALDPEECKTWELGVWDVVGTDATAELVYYHNDFNQLIQAEPTSEPGYPFGAKAGNVGETTTQGVELTINKRVTEEWAWELIFDRLSVWSKSGTPLLRRPKYSGGIALKYDGGRTTGNIRARYVGNRWDNDFAGWMGGKGQHIADEYLVLDLGFTYQLGEALDLWGRCNNLLGHHYEAAAGYPSPSTNFVIGLQRPY